MTKRKDTKRQPPDDLMAALMDSLGFDPVTGLPPDAAGRKQLRERSMKATKDSQRGQN